MASYLLLAHSHWRHLVLLLLAIACLKFLVSWLAKQQWQKLDDYLLRATAVSVYLQVLMGVVLYIIRQAWLIPGYTTGHVIPGFIGMFMVAKASGWAKRGKTDRDKFQWAFIGLVVGSILILVGVWFALTR